MRYFALSFLIFIALLSTASARTQVNVGLTSVQPPFVVDVEAKKGVIFDLLKALNDTQETYEFLPLLYPARRMLSDYKTLNIHVVAFNNVNWGWVQRGGIPSINLTNGRDLFVSLAKSDPNKTDITDIGAVRGFHYAFADYDADKLARMQNVSLVESEADVLKLIKFNRVKKGVISEAFLGWVSISNPQLYKILKIDRANPDHTYHRQLIRLASSPISLEEIDLLLEKMKNNGALQAVYDKYGLNVPDF
ncbi:ABC transporter substrate-binding protein [Sneathiella sp. P13V-1]|uniref:ABC transporter substrate-binding protein n=1 Tax=Sneathiella sp. P13V-1 TaxID=2697366 RepID=UPI00187B4A33|nr:ABC transporter substrate-binding protein [Sneathiella sp. P13V-1]MBE7637140.1 ABC transporter substrate-binding protein [Sneathiella sp. P13V-1]